jgi:hypothetical protein
MKASGLVAGAALVALLLAGCGGDNSASVSVTTAAGGSATTSGGNSSASTTSGGNGGATTTSGGSSGASTTAPSYSGNANSDFCNLAKDISSSDFANSLSDDNTNLKSTLDQLNDVIGKAKDTAPSEIKADVATLADAFKKYRDFFAQYDFDVAKLTAAAQKDPKVLQQATDMLSSSDIETADSHITAYAQQVCGISPDTTS